MMTQDKKFDWNKFGKIAVNILDWAQRVYFMIDIARFIIDQLK